MKYLICHVWQGTKGNHAGMSHMCDLLKQTYNSEYVIFKTNEFELFKSGNYFIDKVVNALKRRLYKQYKKYRYNKILSGLKNNDEVFLLEYMLKSCHQDKIADDIRSHNENVKIIGLSHLSPLVLDEMFSKDEIIEWYNKVDYIMTLGSSLSNYFIKIGIPDSTVITSFHYTDNSYYNCSRDGVIQTTKSINVIVMGNMLRNYSLLFEIVNKMPHISFTLCAGSADYSEFNKFNNVRVLGYLLEADLRTEMASADLSLNVMRDTVGSNVITTSMAMGLAMVVSDVGSIRDYCTSDNSYFCNNTQDYIDGINILDSDREKLQRMKMESQRLSMNFQIGKFHDFITSCKM